MRARRAASATGLDHRRHAVVVESGFEALFILGLGDAWPALDESPRNAGKRLDLDQIVLQVALHLLAGAVRFGPWGRP